METERRQRRRFQLRQPALVRYDNGSQEAAALTRDASILGTYLELDVPLPEHSTIEITLLLTNDSSATVIRLHGYGRVVRVEPLADGKYGVAVAYTQLLS